MLKPESLTSAFGYKQTSSRQKSKSALPPTPDIVEPCAPKYFAGGIFGGRSFRAATKEGICASAPDPLGGLGCLAQPVAPPVASTVPEPIMPEPATPRGDTTWPPRCRDRATRHRSRSRATPPGQRRPRAWEASAGKPRRVPHGPVQRRHPFTGTLPRPAPASCTTGRLRAVQGPKSPYCHPRCHPKQKRGPAEPAQYHAKLLF